MRHRRGTGSKSWLKYRNASECYLLQEANTGMLRNVKMLVVREDHISRSCWNRAPPVVALLAMPRMYNLWRAV